MTIGVLPGLGPAATIAILLPLTYSMEPVTAIIMLAGIFYGAIYGRTVTAVLLKLPGETSSAISALTMVAPIIAGWALRFVPPEYAALTFLGILPGGGATVSSMVSYGLEKRLSKDPKRFGKGAIEGVAGPETANNAAATSSFIPLLTLGIPANATMAVMFGALMIQGIAPGPQLVESEPDLFWGVVNSMYIGNLILLVLAVPMIGLFVRILYVRSTILAPITLLIVCMGAFTISNRFFEVMVVIVFGVLGYLMKKFGFDPAPLVLAFVLGALLEDNFRRALMMFEGDISQVADRPITLVLLSIFLLVLILPVVMKMVTRRRNPNPLPDSSAETEETHVR